MSIDRKLVKKLAESKAQPEPTPATSKPKGKPDEVVKHLKQAWSLAHRIRAGEDLEDAWRKLNRNLRFLIRATRKVARRRDEYGFARSTNPEASAVARAMLADLADARDLATLLDHPADSPLWHEGAFVLRRLAVEITAEDGEFILKFDGEEAGRFKSMDDAQGYANFCEANLTHRAVSSEPGVVGGGWDAGPEDEHSRWTRYTRWGKLVVVLSLLV